MKAWERDNMPKDIWFKEKYGHIHAMQKEYRQKQKMKKKLLLQKEKYGKTGKVKDVYNSRTGHKIAQVYKNPLMEYVYGTNTVIAALENDKRRIKSKLYYVPPIKNKSILEICKNKNIPLAAVTRHDLNILSNQGVHNDVILETKPLKIPFVSYLKTVNFETPVDENDKINHGTKQEGNLIDIEQNNNHNIFHLCEATTLGEESTKLISCFCNKNELKKFPLGLMLDEIVDTHNLGAIIRSAFYLGVDFVLLSQRNSAPLSPVVNKASSGAMELLPVYSIADSNQFMEMTQEKSNWTFIASHTVNKTKWSNMNLQAKMLPLHEMSNMLQETPVILMMGNENKGIHKELLHMSDYLVQIPSGRDTHSVDSLNVSVATSILLSKLLI